MTPGGAILIVQLDSDRTSLGRELRRHSDGTHLSSAKSTIATRETRLDVHTDTLFFLREAGTKVVKYYFSLRVVKETVEVLCWCKFKIVFSYIHYFVHIVYLSYTDSVCNS